jgi:hypothetical protein
MNNAADNEASTSSSSFYPQQQAGQWAWPQQCHDPECQRRIHEATVESHALRNKVKHLEEIVRQMRSEMRSRAVV